MIFVVNFCRYGANGVTVFRWCILFHVAVVVVRCFPIPMAAGFIRPSTSSKVSTHYSKHGVITGISMTTIGCAQPRGTIDARTTTEATTVHRGTTVARHLPYDTTISALRAYHSVNGHLVMPWRFVVSDPDVYPAAWLGYDLPLTVYHMDWWQAHVRNHPTRVNELNTLGFVWERLQPKWNIVMEAFVTYHSLHGHIRVPDGFVVPTNDTTWPKATWRIPLGKTVARIRQRNDFLLDPTTSYERRQQLDRMGFVWNCHDQSFWKFYTALRHYRLLYYNNEQQPLCVPVKYVVPHNTTEWPNDLWGYPLGLRCRSVLHEDLYLKARSPDENDDAAQRRQLIADLGGLQRSTHLNWLRISHAAAIYSRLHNGSLHVPPQFVVPETWPRNLWGLPLGARLQDIRNNGTYLKGREGPTRRRQLEALGFVWDAGEERFRVYCRVVEWFRKVHGTETDIPVLFVVPSAAPWPMDMWEYPLGARTKQIRVTQQFIKNRPDRREELLRLGVRLENLKPSL